MRIGEVLQTTRSSLVLPEDMLYSPHFILVRRGAKNAEQWPATPITEDRGRGLCQEYRHGFPQLQGKTRSSGPCLLRHCESASTRRCTSELCQDPKVPGPSILDHSELVGGLARG